MGIFEVFGWRMSLSWGNWGVWKFLDGKELNKEFGLGNF